MTYELAKQLKDAGFTSLVDISDQYLAPEYQNQPDLSELIEACGEGIDLTNIKAIRNSVESNKLWVALKSYGVVKPFVVADGETPEEAVAKLWLAIHSQELKDSKDNRLEL